MYNDISWCIIKKENEKGGKGLRFVKYIPNLLTTLRLLSAAALIFVEPLSATFLVIYTLAGVSDALDGFIARAAGCTSALGAKLDSLADLSFYAVMLLKVFPVMTMLLPSWIWYYVGAVLLVRLVSYSVAAIKFRRFASIHTYLNKTTGLFMFLTPYIISTELFTGFSVFLCSVAALASLEELTVHATNREYIPEQKTLFVKKK